MPKTKTPMRELIEELKIARSKLLNVPELYELMTNIIELAESKLPAERIMGINLYVAGGISNEMASDYFTENYEQ